MKRFRSAFFLALLAGLLSAAALFRLGLAPEVPAEYNLVTRVVHSNIASTPQQEQPLPATWAASPAGFASAESCPARPGGATHTPPRPGPAATPTGAQASACAGLPEVQPAPEAEQAREDRTQEEEAPARTVEVEELSRLACKRFEDWIRRYRSEELPGGKASLAVEGKRLAAERREALKALIETNPQQALALAVQDRVRAELPASVQEQLETRLSGRGAYRVMGILPESGRPYLERTAVLRGKTYRASVYGRRLEQTTKEGLPLHGIALDDIMAVHESPARVLGPEDLPSPDAAAGNPDGNCPVSKRPASEAFRVEVGGEVYTLCQGGHLAAFEKELLAAEGGVGPSAAPLEVAQSAWTTGTKTILFIRVNYPDKLADPQSQSSAQAMMDSGSAWFKENSYGATEWVTTVTPLFTLPKTEAEYITLGHAQLYADAVAAAKAKGYDAAAYSLEAVRYNGGPGGFLGAAALGMRGCWLKSSSVGVACHEFGHNYGLAHANYWNATGDSIIGPGSNSEYGDDFDTMGAAGAGAQHFNAYEKNKLDWIPVANVNTITASGTYRIYAFDQPVLTGGLLYGLRIKKDADRDYWLDLRQKHTGNRWLMSGVDLYWDPWPNSNGGTQLLDTTPGSPDGKTDSAVTLGRTFSDALTGIHMTPLGKGGTTPESIDVVVNLGSFPSNLPPTVTVTASATAVAAGVTVNFVASAGDPNGDTLAYHWDFGDKNFGTNSTTASKSWGAAGEYVVRCTVTDMKGGTASDSVLVKVGTPPVYRIGGTVTSGGQALAGVRVYASSTLVTCTDSDGTYNLVNLPAGSYTLNAAKYGYTLALSGFINPVAVGPNAAGINFTATPAPPAAYSISGAVTSFGVGVQWVTISDGTRTATTDSAGNYTLSNVPNGQWNLTGTLSGYTVTPFFENPLWVSGANLTGKRFWAIAGTTYTVSGTVTEAGLPLTGVSVSDGTRSSTTDTLGKYVIVGVPNGSYTLTPSKASYAFTPVTRSVSVSGAHRAGQDFAAQAKGPKALKRDFDGDGKADVLFRHSSSGEVYLWLLK